MMQGDAYCILIEDTGVDLDVVSKIEFNIGGISKVYPDDVTYDDENMAFAFPVSQAESLTMLGQYKCTARIKYSDNQVEGLDIGTIAPHGFVGAKGPKAVKVGAVEQVHLATNE